MATYVLFRGHRFDQRTIDMLLEAERIAGTTFRIIQGGFNPSGVKASAGTHDGSGAVDLWPADGDTDKAVAALRQVGFAAWHRTPEQGFKHHIHGIAVEAKGLAAEAARQVAAYLAGRNGLASRKADDGPRDWVGVTWESYRAGKAPAAPSAPYTGKHRTVTVKRGQTLGGIAAMLGVSVAALVGVNHLSNPDRIQPGQVLVVPGPTVTVPAKPAPKPTTKAPVRPSPPVKAVPKAKPAKTAKPAQRPTATRTAVTAGNLRPGKRNADVKVYAAALWAAQPATYRARHKVAWMRESSTLYGPMVEKVTADTYARLHKADPAHWGPGRFTWPGPSLLARLGLRGR